MLQQSDATSDLVIDAGYAIMVTIYNGVTGTDTLTSLRYNMYCKMAATKGAFLADRLPPTEDATSLLAK